MTIEGNLQYFDWTAEMKVIALNIKIEEQDKATIILLAGSHPHCSVTFPTVLFPISAEILFGPIYL